MFSVKLNKSTKDDTDILNRLLLSHDSWVRPPIPYTGAAVTLIKQRMKKFGIRLIINQRYSKRFYCRAMQFKTESEYTMFRLKWS